MPEWVADLMLSEPIRQWLKYEKGIEDEMLSAGSVRLEDICDWCSGFPCQCSLILEAELTEAPTDATAF